jgi:hypothetical protein
MARYGRLLTEKQLLGQIGCNAPESAQQAMKPLALSRGRFPFPIMHPGVP